MSTEDQKPKTGEALPQTLELHGSAAPAGLLHPAQFKALRALLLESIAKSEEALELIRAVAGPEPAAPVEKLRLSINHGTGFLRLCVGQIDAMFATVEKILLQQRCPHERLKHQGHQAFCKVCSLEMVRNRVSGEYEPMWNSGGNI